MTPGQQPLLTSSKPIFSQRTEEQVYNEINEYIYQKIKRPVDMDTRSHCWKSAQEIELSAKAGLECSRFSESEILQISDRLGDFEKRWSTVARTYIILHFINHIDMLDNIIEFDFNDYWLPASQGQLPGLLNPAARTEFLRAQHVVLTKVTDLIDGCRNHKHFADHEQIPFEPISLLGFGGFAQVEKVVCKLDGNEYARKRIRRDISFKKTRTSMKSFITELDILKKLDHHHIVKLVGSYTDPSYLVLLMSPVADCNLADYIANDVALLQKKRHVSTFFGCLASAIAYLHRSGIRHKDIKPQNVLVKGDNVLLTDFGLSRISHGTAHSTTDGLTAKSSRYCAPEVANYEPRNSSSDIWSLGCIFVEMVTVLKDCTVKSMWEYFESHGSGGLYYSDNLPASKGWFQALRSMEPKSANDPLLWAEDMLQHERHLRPTAQALVKKIRYQSSYNAFCGSCCLGPSMTDTAITG
ncbi:kinase-like protein [Lojkania enalia]|uniref:Kinase-like protein n=1 Tax=Lojkania enalia TaxID=147567 RepID=A0A9P4JWM5_9PLEO|nr:kinase-like protein [Didymosphaeria enalia]